jgi:hypothetical protein
MAHYYVEHQKLSGEEARKNADFDFLLWDAAQRLSPDQFEKVRTKIERVLMRRPNLELVKGGREDDETEL